MVSLYAAQLTNVLHLLYTQSMEKSSIRWWDLPSAILLFLAILFSAWRLQSTNWTDGLEHVRNMALLGLVLGLALGSSRYQKRSVILLTIGYTLFVFVWQVLSEIKFSNRETYLGDRLLILAGRLQPGLKEFFAGKPVEDTLFFLALLCIVYWFTALISGYQTTRHANALAAVLPSGILMFIVFIVQYTVHDYSWLFGAYLFVTFLFLGRQKYLVDKKRWKERRIQVSAESGTDFNNTMMISAALVILIVWILPSSLPYNATARETWIEMSNKWFKNDHWDNVFAAAKKENPPVSDLYQDNLALGTQAMEGAAIEFLVFVPPPALELPRLYWRGHIYDRFEDGHWLATGVKNLNFKPQDGDFEIQGTRNSINLDFEFNVYQQGQTILYTASQPLWISHAIHITYKKISTERGNLAVKEDLGQTLDIVSMQATSYLTVGETYHADSLVANPSISELREAGDDYPTWVNDSYLQLPHDFSTRIHELALQITADQGNAYEKALAITNYLRREIQYKPSISFPEQTVDPLEYFLFDIKQGFCNYYASAETLMLRSIGIPARLAVGFAQGEANLQNATFTVRERDAHAWPEVYFPNYGWIEFEPTGNQPEIERPEKTQETSSLSPNLHNPLEPNKATGENPVNQTLDEKNTNTFSRTLILQISIGVGAFLLGFFAVLLKKRYAPNIQTTGILKSILENNGWNIPVWLNNWIHWTELTPFEKYFQSINIGLNWMGKPQAVHATPAMRANILADLVPSAAPSIHIVLHEHQGALFTPHSGNKLLARRAAVDILYQIITLRIKTFLFG